MNHQKPYERLDDYHTAFVLEIIRSNGGLPDTPEVNANPIAYLMSQCKPIKRYPKKRWTHPENTYSRERES